ncbi:MAG: dTDP-glucose 4,6-dehydratase [Deltaproteobacteria bacterium]|nr:dTDP-glucose 4,6-dehydratase [Deltaproteobacteria bacterium]MBW2663197.1 dTDP-glucose 4,6-dehydratase [Deltaproteobacteria bacterium]
MKNMLVTGGCGFIGSNFIRYMLSESGYKGRIINVDKLTYAGNPENLAGIDKKFPGRYCFVKADICDRPAMQMVFEKFSIDSVCHFAAESHVDRSIAEPDAFIKTNITGTFNLLELVRFYKDKILLFHHISTDEVYGSISDGSYFTEDTPYHPNSPYSASKAASDHLVRAYGTTYGIPVTISNCSNNYGPYQFPEKLIPLIILNAFEGKALPVYGNGLNIRDWLYVKDHCKAVWLIMQNGKRGETYNVGGNCEMRNIDVVKMICDLIEKMMPSPNHPHLQDLITFVKDRPGHDLRYAIDSNKLQRELDWVPAESFETGIKKTIEWYIDNKNWVDRVKSGEYMSWIKRQYDL